MIHLVLGVVGFIVFGLIYFKWIRPATEPRRYSRSRLIRRKGEHSAGCGCRKHRVK